MSPDMSPVGVEIKKVVRQLRGRACGTTLRTYTDRMAVEDSQNADVIETLAADCARLEAEVARLVALTTESECCQADHSGPCGPFEEMQRERDDETDRADRLTAALAESAAREAEFREALELFGKAWTEAVADMGDTTGSLGAYGALACRHVAGTHFRRACSLLAARRDEVTG